MSNVQKAMTNVQANLQRNSFDLSERHLFSGKVGQLLPVYNKQVVPGDYFEIDPVLFMRTMKLNTASFARMRQHLEFFFVPYSQLWHRFPEFKYQRSDQTSSVQPLSGSTVPVCSPYVKLSTLYSQILHKTDPTIESSTVDTDSFGFIEAAESARLCDLLGYGSLRNRFIIEDSDVQGVLQLTSGLVSQDLSSKHVNIWPWLAYQKIWSDVYRNPWYDVNINPENFNVDDIPCDSVSNADIFSYRTSASTSYSDTLKGIFTLRYRQWKKDYFTGLFPDQQFGDVSMVIGSQSSLLGASNYDVTNPNSLSLDPLVTISGNAPYRTGVDDSSGNFHYLLTRNTGVSAIDLRRAELLQVWKEKTMRAGYRSESQQRAHFGVDSDYIPDNHVRPLGGISQVVDINEVVSTSIYSNDVNISDGLGELAGKGTSLNTGEKIRFQVKDDGIIMAIFSILPESEYSAYGLAAEHQRIDAFDYFTPAFQNLGFKAVTNLELDVSYAVDGGTQNVGFAPPYYDMKIGIDKVHGEFIPALPAERSSHYPVMDTERGSLSAFDLARRDLRVGTLSFFYASPHVTDQIFAFNADSDQKTDQFYCNLYLDIKAVRPMSVLGLPNF